MRTARRISQLVVFLLFAFLFLGTEYKDDDVLPYAVNFFLRLDPLVAGAAALAGRALISLVWPALVLVALTVLLGRFFCGWACPMGAILDAADATVFRKRKRRAAVPVAWRRAKYGILLFLAVSALFSLQWVFLLDPISLLIRSLTLSVFPAMNLALRSLFDGVYTLPLGPVNEASEAAYDFLKAHFLAFERPVFRMAGIVGLIFVAVVVAERWQKRFWCRNLCPLGAMLALAGRFGLLRRRVLSSDCTSCGLCDRDCRMGAIEGHEATEHGECIQCLDCRTVCPPGAIRFHGREGRKDVPVDLTRRGILAASALGAVTVPFFLSEAHGKAPDPSLVRPPGALPEDEFLARCTRCGECMRVCIANGLQPALFEAGLAGLWSPFLVPRVGYCEYNCTLCGQVCPTGAIRRLDLAKKQSVKIGLADIDRSRCLPWNGNSECIVCEEHCPTPVKAIRLREEEVYSVNSGTMIKVQRPYVDEKLCIGCGICETKCPLSDRSAIIVSCRGESRAEESFR